MAKKARGVYKIPLAEMLASQLGCFFLPRLSWGFVIFSHFRKDSIGGTLDFLSVHFT